MNYKVVCPQVPLHHNQESLNSLRSTSHEDAFDSRELGLRQPL